MLTIVTNEIMDTCLFIGGDFKNIIDITKQYVTMGGIRRIKKAHEGILKCNIIVKYQHQKRNA